SGATAPARRLRSGPRSRAGSAIRRRVMRARRSSDWDRVQDREVRPEAGPAPRPGSPGADRLPRHPPARPDVPSRVDPPPSTGATSGKPRRHSERLVATAPSADVYRGLVYSYRMAGRDEDAARVTAAEYQEQTSGTVTDGGTICATAVGNKCTFQLDLCVNQSGASCTPKDLKMRTIHAAGLCAGGIGKVKVKANGTSSACGNLAGVK